MQTVKQERQLSKERMKSQTNNFIDCNIADYAEILKIGKFLQIRPARNSAGLCGEAEKPTIVEGGQLLRRISPGSRIGPIKEILFF